MSDFLPTASINASALREVAETTQKVALGANRSGKLTAIRHQTGTYANVNEFFEPSGKQTLVLYIAPVREITYKVVNGER